MKCETCLNSRTGISENGYHYVCTLSAKKAANCITNDYKHYVKSSLDIPQKPITNADRIRDMTDEELATYFDKMQGVAYVNGFGNEPISLYPNNYGAWLDWLRQEVES